MTSPILTLQDEIDKVDHKDPNIRIYERMGARYLSVTQALRVINKERMNIARHKYTKEQWAKKRDTARDLGVALHALVEKDCKGETVVVEPVLERAFDNWLKMKKDCNIKPLYSEIKVVHPIYHYGGTIDLVGEINGQMVIADLKSGWYGQEAGLQVAAYLKAVQYWEPELKDAGMAVIHIKADGSVAKPFLYEHTESCFKQFLKTLDSYKFFHYRFLEKIKYPHIWEDCCEKYYHTEKDSTWGRTSASQLSFT